MGTANGLDAGVIRLVAFAMVSLLISGAVSGCRLSKPGGELKRHGDEIMACGRLFHTGTPVVLWTDPGGYDAYRVERRFAAWTNASWEATRAEGASLDTPNRYGLRREGLSPETLEKVRGGGWDLVTLQGVVDQFVLHYDATGTSRRCFEVLHDRRGLSVHFMLDVDGTIYQTLDLKERAWHATTSNTRSIGIEIAQPGAVPLAQSNRLSAWYRTDARGVRLDPSQVGKDSGVRAPDFEGRPARPGLVVGNIQGIELVQYDFTPQQYEALARLTAALCRVFPGIRCEAPRDASGAVVNVKLPDDQLRAYSGVLGHYHIQTDKVDPGPAFDWDRYLREARRWLR